MSNPNDQALPLAESDPVNNVVGMPPLLEETTPMVQALVIKRMDEEMSPPIVRTRSSMMQGPPAPLDDHQRTILEPLLITLAYPLTIHWVLATLGRYPNLMEPAIPSGRTR
jgi:hypothetical protein